MAGDGLVTPGIIRGRVGRPIPLFLSTAAGRARRQEMIGGRNPLAKVTREIRLTLLPIEWSTKYPKIYILRWIAVGSAVAALTGHLPLGRLQPFCKAGRGGKPAPP